MTTEKIIAAAIALAIVGCIYWAMRRRRHHDAQRLDPSLKREADDRRNNNERTP